MVQTRGRVVTCLNLETRMSGHSGNDMAAANLMPPSLASSPTSSSSPVVSSHAVTTASTIFMSEGTPRQELLRSPHENSTGSAPASMADQQTFLLPPSAIHPITSLELRVRWLEALVSGVNTVDGRSTKAEKSAKETSWNAHRIGLLKQATEVQRQLDQIVSDNDQLRRFMGNCQSTTLMSLKPTDASRLL